MAVIFAALIVGIVSAAAGALGADEVANVLTGGTSPAAAPAVEAAKGFFETILSPEFAAKLIALVVGVQLILRGLAEGLTKIAEVTETKADNKVAGWLGEAAWVLGAVIGKFGFGTPKAVITDQAEKLKPGA